ncbi:hypothetical protein K458DRAFT_289253 [Lentithecium fluviatile CBS 122367]|uniref:Uncharacterized protein n=1 Tax=Lentithecium fluviatile CBS 122367 TaxID=1168545 RepID=A0A6G1JI23_9PLEO|nr:hypothetical protein K458DRAFT_289253 [Lentithecium fluviatile CBS 122367]
MPRKKQALPTISKTGRTAVTTKKTKNASAAAKKKKKGAAATKSKKATAKKTKISPPETESDSDSTPATNNVILMQPRMKRKERIVDPSNPADAALIAAATKAGTDIYDSDAEDLPNGALKGVKKRHLFRNVNWGPAASDLTNDSEFPADPGFTQFVPGRWERQSDGTVADQKRKLLVKLTNKYGRKRIFCNPPPADWSSQEAITALNKRTVQQIRRCTGVRYRGVVTPYVEEERVWIRDNLRDGRPVGTWAEFVKAFNGRFRGKMSAGAVEPRPERTKPSLSKEVERFGQFYSKGLVPVLTGVA